MLGRRYVYKWFDVEREPPEGFFWYSLYKIYFRLRHPIWGLTRKRMDFKKIGSTTIPVADLELTHNVGEWFDLKLWRRIDRLREAKLGSLITIDDMNKLCPSIANIRVCVSEDKFKVVDGNGRVFALQHTYPDSKVEVDIIEARENNMQWRTKKEPEIGTLRIKKKFALLPVEFQENHKVWLELCYVCEEYRRDLGAYGHTHGWQRQAIVPAKNTPFNQLLTSPCKYHRHLGEVLYKEKKRKNGREAG